MHEILVDLLRLIRAALSSLYFLQPSIPLDKQRFGIGDDHHRIVMRVEFRLLIILCVIWPLPVHSLIRWSISDLPVSVR